VEERAIPTSSNIEASTALVMAELEAQLGIQQSPTPIAYQSRVGPVEWLKPYTDEALVLDLGGEGVKELVCPDQFFVSEQHRNPRENRHRVPGDRDKAGILEIFAGSPALDYLPHLSIKGLPIWSETALR